jgi:hypothetical protein
MRLVPDVPEETLVVRSDLGLGTSSLSDNIVIAANSGRSLVMRARLLDVTVNVIASGWVGSPGCALSVANAFLRSLEGYTDS